MTSERQDMYLQQAERYYKRSQRLGHLKLLQSMMLRALADDAALTMETDEERIAVNTAIGFSYAMYGACENDA